MILRLAFIAAVLVTLAQLPGCHFFIEGTPRIIISSEPIAANQH